MKPAYIAMGSNLGDREDNLRRAIDLMNATEGIQVKRVSTFVQTDPVGPAGQGKYMNAAAEIQTTLEPHDLLAELMRIERQLGRDRAREQRWGPRTCDLDILLMEDTVIQTPELTIPHPRMHERSFVLEPLSQIAPEAVHPLLGKTVAWLLKQLATE